MPSSIRKFGNFLAAPFKTLFLETFTWWHRQTLGVWWHTLRRGSLVGADEFGNRYYRDRRDASRRWVVYAGEIEASNIPPGWHAWLHHTVDESPAEQKRYTPRPWEREHLPNLTGTPDAYAPKGSLRRGTHARNDDNYHAWNPEGDKK
ncbi:MAG: NADH:ubiquinone oxidoreductase subunit NDUFA12 [Hyphomicrobiales bacterium]|nr:NADH:ubiquinone oxidoreductase subunit NDUFA12 [Hyphomicrobiales bacterium]MCY4054155.1 NADH:ubiquinone oxidoreductase subunit NDUFA12 [Hyphomicrobiales bacterium]